MLLQDIFSVSRIKVRLEAGDKDEVFEELADVLVQSYNLSESRDLILASINEREEKMSTGIKTGIALPHGKADISDGLYGAIGISEDGIDYDALDGEPVYLVILLVCSARNSGFHLRTLKRIAGLLEIPDFYADMRSASGAENAHAILKKYEDILEKNGN